MQRADLPLDGINISVPLTGMDSNNYVVTIVETPERQYFREKLDEMESQDLFEIHLPIVMDILCASNEL